MTFRLAILSSLFLMISCNLNEDAKNKFHSDRRASIDNVGGKTELLDNQYDLSDTLGIQEWKTWYISNSEYLHFRLSQGNMTNIQLIYKPAWKHIIQLHELELLDEKRLDSYKDVIMVEIKSPDKISALRVVTSDGKFVSPIDLIEIREGWGNNRYEAIFPAVSCGELIKLYISSEGQLNLWELDSTILKFIPSLRTSNLTADAI